MSISPGDRLGPYEVLALLGAGGMGEVYRARDTRLKREVALKVLPETFANDAERMARFQREAEVLASLNHPNIATIHGVEADALVMEFVPGDTLPCPVPLATALDLARQIAEALEYAHERGVIHRDLKPANIKVMADGRVKLLDFGLAKSLEGPAGATDNPANSPTLTLGAGTRLGVIIGTAAYMSPEQAVGKAADRRSDIFSFGVVLYEMLTGVRAFAGETAGDTLASVVKDEPDWTKLAPETPSAIRTLVRRCLAKDRKQRLQAIGEARIALEKPAEEPPVASVTVVGRSTRAWPWIAVATVLALAVPAAWYFKPRPDSPLLTLEVPPPGTSFASSTLRFVLSPDGAHAVQIVVDRDHRTSLWLRTMDSGVSVPLPGTDSPHTPFWSPDSKWMAFFADGKLKKVAIAGGQPVVICDAIWGYGSWGKEDVILFSADHEADLKPLYRVPATAGTPVPALPFDAARHEVRQGNPSFLPDGKHFLYGSYRNGIDGGIVWASLDGRDRKEIATGYTLASYVQNPEVGNGWLIHSGGDRLVARAFDPERGELIGADLLIASPVLSGPHWSASSTGLFSFSPAAEPLFQFTWFRRDGTRLGTVGEPGNVDGPRISPGDQGTLAFGRTSGNSDIWLLDPSRKDPTQWTFDPGADRNPLWTPDGNRVIYFTIRGAESYLVERSSKGGGDDHVLKKFADRGNRTPTGITRDERWLSVEYSSAGNRHSVLISRPDGTEVPFPEVRARGAISPDGRWMLYSTDKSGKTEVLVQSVPKDAGGPASPKTYRISTAITLALPRWRADGRELYYVAPDGNLMGVSVDSSDGNITLGDPMKLFQTGGVQNLQYDVTADGNRFLLRQPVDASDPPVTILVNWTKVLKN